MWCQMFKYHLPPDPEPSNYSEKFRMISVEVHQLNVFLPFLQVTGSKNEDQVLNAIETYTEFRPELAHRAINQLFDIARIQHCSQLLRALQV